ncbi:type VI secretion system-associated protein TagF [Roseibium sp.]|uniref:type VI secretion system-associated protein TagF n=1 Tax=Roseibium sp. TaxID=1936156 RepID=UPI003B510085
MQPDLSGYFGKLPDRADFVTGRCPDGFLKLWEPFLMRGLAQSRQQLGDDWEEAYMTMPVWRFLVRPSPVAGASLVPVAGALMPSVDKVGRKFPLTVVAALDDAGSSGQPLQDWHDGVEAALVGALHEEATLSGFQQAVADLAAPVADAEGQATAACEHLEPDPETRDRVSSRFWCEAGPKSYGFDSDGLPAPEAFRWLLLPEAFEPGTDKRELAGQQHGRYQEEDHRT